MWRRAGLKEAFKNRGPGSMEQKTILTLNAILDTFFVKTVIPQTWPIMHANILGRVAKFHTFFQGFPNGSKSKRG